MPNPWDPNNPQNPNNPMFAGTPSQPQSGQSNPFIGGGLAPQAAFQMAKMLASRNASSPMTTPEFSTASPANPYANGMFGNPGGMGPPGMGGGPMAGAPGGSATGSVGMPPGAAAAGGAGMPPNIWSQGTGAVPFTDQTMAGLFPTG